MARAGEIRAGPNHVRGMTNGAEVPEEMSLVGAASRPGWARYDEEYPFERSAAAGAERLACLPPTKANGFDPWPGHSGFSPVGIVPYDAAGRPGFPLTPALLRNHLISPSPALEISMLTATQISSLSLESALSHYLARALLCALSRPRPLKLKEPSFLSEDTQIARAKKAGNHIKLMSRFRKPYHFALLTAGGGGRAHLSAFGNIRPTDEGETRVRFPYVGKLQALRSWREVFICPQASWCRKLTIPFQVNDTSSHHRNWILVPRLVFPTGVAYLWACLADVRVRARAAGPRPVSVNDQSIKGYENAELRGHDALSVTKLLRRISSLFRWRVERFVGSRHPRSREPMRVKRDEYGVELECKGGRRRQIHEETPPPTNDIVRSDSHVGRSGSDPTGSPSLKKPPSLYLSTAQRPWRPFDKKHSADYAWFADAGVSPQCRAPSVNVRRRHNNPEASIAHCGPTRVIAELRVVESRGRSWQKGNGN
ncbi:hypothetical protein PR048_022773 [Dryococelus australis]|uniref:Uncharacterized protein n=1 Tax=Dryococelus australis TaxID=614101 RepID=A0ABQ9GS78_9NEOP|nr:hypothetical protein PR048_022773 [Dryococelus australis]